MWPYSGVVPNELHVPWRGYYGSFSSYLNIGHDGCKPDLPLDDPARDGMGCVDFTESSVYAFQVRLKLGEREYGPASNVASIAIIHREEEFDFSGPEPTGSCTGSGAEPAFACVPGPLPALPGGGTPAYELPHHEWRYYRIGRPYGHPNSHMLGYVGNGGSYQVAQPRVKPSFQASYDADAEEVTLGPVSAGAA